MSNDFIGTMGWAEELERRDVLLATETPFELPMMGDPPEEIDPRPFHRTEVQGQVGACQGFDLSSVVEHCYHIATGEVEQFSPAHGYYGTQRIDGLLGRDSGSTISGGVELVTKIGLVKDAVWPYIARYSPKPPVSWEEIEELAAAFKIKSHSVLRSYDDIFNYLATGTGAVTTGTSWGWNPNSEGVVEQFSRGSGGHATAMLGYSRRKDSKGRRYVFLLNSWGTNWGNGGWAEIAPAAIDGALKDRNAVFIGISDLTTPSVRPIDWSKNHGI